MEGLDGEEKENQLLIYVDGKSHNQVMYLKRHHP